jgi:hypothetical protein
MILGLFHPDFLLFLEAFKFPLQIRNAETQLFLPSSSSSAREIGVVERASYCSLCRTRTLLTGLEPRTVTYLY